MLRHWKIKAMVEGVISLTPWRNGINNLLQQYVTGRLTLTPNRFEVKVRQCHRHMECAREARGGERSPFTVLELGTGWYPIVPVGLYLCGAKCVWSVDIVDLLSSRRVKEVLRCYVEYGQAGKLGGTLPGYRHDRMAVLQDILSSARPSPTTSEMLERMSIQTMVRDVRDIKLGDGSVDMFVSNCVLEHIPPDVIAGIFAKFRRLASPSAVMIHLIDMRDHCADFDSSITPYNFLKYPSRTWRWYNNPLHYQNRLRTTDYRRLHREGGFRIVAEHAVHGPQALRERVQPADEFLRYPEADLWALECRIVSVPRRGEARG